MVDANAPPVDANTPPLDGNPCFGGGFVQLCLDALPRDAFVLDASRQIDTDHDSRCTSFMPANPEWCVISATQITIAAGVTLSAIGARPLVLVATEALWIDGTIDVASHLVGGTHVRGAGAAPRECVGPSVASYPGAGAGGSFRSRGGNGGNRPASSGGGVAAGPTPATKLRGGCAGGDGGFADPNPGGEHGDGGGAVYLLAPMITVSATGVVNASGSGGTPALYDDFTGGGGGGSGGMIGLDAPAIRLAAGARLFANGGGGGEGTGCPFTGGGSAANGQDPKSPTVPALGGRQQSNGGDGGDGALSTIDGGNGADGTGCNGGSGGGGGGGGVGAIVVHGTVTDTGAQISPPAVALP